jgi:hypothetical protein
MCKIQLQNYYFYPNNFFDAFLSKTLINSVITQKHFQINIKNIRQISGNEAYASGTEDPGSNPAREKGFKGLHGNAVDLVFMVSVFLVEI